jgi:pre-mRNA-splicing factor ATP-dependent RNA helicase DHX16
VVCGDAQLTKSRDYQTIKHAHTVHIHPSSVLSKDQREGILHSHLIYHELAFTSKEYMRSITPIQPQWLLEVAQHYYDAASIEDPSAKKKMPKAVGAAPGHSDR